MSKSVRLILRDVRCVWPKLFRPDDFKGKRKFSVSLIITKGSENEKKLYAAIRKAVVEQYGPADSEARLRKFKQTGVTKFPIKPYGDTEDLMITPKLDAEKAPNGPKVLDQHKKDIPLEQESRIQPGYWLNASVDVFCHNKEGGGLAFYLNGVQLVREDALLAGASSVETCGDDFEDLGDTGVEEAGEEDFI